MTTLYVLGLMFIASLVTGFVAAWIAYDRGVEAERDRWQHNCVRMGVAEWATDIQGRCFWKWKDTQDKEKVDV